MVTGAQNRRSEVEKMSWPAVKRAFDKEGFRKYVLDLPASRWRPSMIVWHNTAAPTLAQWIKSGDQDRAAGRVAGITRINNLEMFFRDNNHWSGCPHLFIAPDYIWVMNPLTSAGVHSPSWNSISIGIEMIADFDREDDETGAGLLVKQSTVYATAVLCEAFGLQPRPDVIRLHKEDKKTTHDCPGKNIAVDKLRMIEAVQALMTGGEHDPAKESHVITSGNPILTPDAVKFGITVEDLNFRAGPSAISELKGHIPPNTKVEILDRAENGSTAWLRVKTPGGYVGWAAGRYIKEEGK